MRLDCAIDTVLDRLMAGVMLFGASGQLVYSNAAIVRYGRADLLPAPGSSHYCHVGNVDLRSAIGAVLCGGVTTGATLLLHHSGKPPLVTTIIPAGTAGAIDGDDLACAVLFAPADVPISAATTLMARAYNLTVAETRLLRLLLDSETLDEAAIALGVKRGTVVSHLKSIFMKVNVQRQSDLVRLAWQMSPLVG